MIGAIKLQKYFPQIKTETSILSWLVNGLLAVRVYLYNKSSPQSTPSSDQSLCQWSLLVNVHCRQREKWPALLVVLYLLCMFFACFCIINWINVWPRVWQCVEWHHVTMRLYSYISGSQLQVVLESMFDTAQPANTCWGG